MQWIRISLTGVLLLAASITAYGQSQIYCPSTPEERSPRCTRVITEIADHQRAIESAENQLRSPAVILARVEKLPSESLTDYRTRVRRQPGVATPQSNTWLPVQGHYYNPVQRQMYVALAREAYWHYVWEKLSFDPDLAGAEFKRREQQSRIEKAFQLENPDSAANQRRYRLESLLAFQRECCTASDGPVTMPSADADQVSAPAIAPIPPAGKPASSQP